MRTEARESPGPAREIELTVDSVGTVPGLLLLPTDAIALLVLAHGAGAGPSHPFMAGVCRSLVEHRIGSLRPTFPYVAAGRRRPDPPSVLHATVRAGLSAARDLAPNVPRFAGGKSLGGRMTTQLAARGPLGVRGIVLLGFPLHPAGRPGIERAAHLAAVGEPMLFVQGDRDQLCDLALLRPVIDPLGSRARLHVVAHADHGFAVLRRSGRDAAEVHQELVNAVVDFVGALVA